MTAAALRMTWPQFASQAQYFGLEKLRNALAQLSIVDGNLAELLRF